MADWMEKESSQEDFKMDIFSIIRDVLKDWWMVLTAGIVGAMCAYMVLGMGYTPLYTSSATLLVSAKGAAGGAASDLSVTTSMAETLTQVMDSRLLKKRVQEELGLETLSAEIEAAVIPETNMMTLSVTSSAPDMSFKVIKSILANYTSVTDYVMDEVVMSVLQAPTVPVSPSNSVSYTDVMKQVCLYSMAGMILLLALISYLKDAVKNEKEVEAKLDIRLFASVYHENKYKTIKSRLKKEKKGVLITDPTMSFLFVETYKKIRTKLMYQAGQNQGKVLLVTSVLENEGKSTVAANIALALAQKSERVVLIDGDLRRPALYKILGINMKPEGEIGAYLTGGEDSRLYLVKSKNKNLSVILGSRSYSNSTEMVSSGSMKRLVSRMRKAAEYVVIDSPPMSLMADAEILAEYADMSLLVVKQGMARTKDINDVIDVLENGNSKLLGCIYNDVRTGIISGTGKRRYGYGYGYRYGYGYGYGYRKYRGDGYGKQK